MTKLNQMEPDVAQQQSVARVVVVDGGGYRLYGVPYISRQIITPDAMGESWCYRPDGEFATGCEEGREALLCRCGASGSKPFCDGTHARVEWDSETQVPGDRLLDGARYFEGEELLLTDSERYCCYARFCHPGGGVWHLTEESGDPESRALAIREAMLCPSARLMAWGRGEDSPYEFDFEPSVVVLEDPEAGCSAGLWLRGGVVVESEGGEEYERRNRVVLCRCGKSHNKPYCDGAHASEGWRDEMGDK